MDAIPSGVGWSLNQHGPAYNAVIHNHSYSRDRLFGIYIDLVHLIYGKAMGYGHKTVLVRPTCSKHRRPAHTDNPNNDGDTDNRDTVM